MKLTVFIDMALGHLEADGKVSAVSRYAKVHGPLGMYLSRTGREDADITSLLDVNFIRGYRTFLENEYPALQPQETITEKNVAKHLKSLLTLGRMAIKDYGLLPNLKIMAETPISEEPEIKTLRRDCLETFRRVFDFYAKNVDEAQSASDVMKRVRLRSLAYWLLAVLLDQPDVGSLVNLQCKNLDNTQLTQTARMMIALNEGVFDSPDDYILPLLTPVDTPEDVEIKVGRLEKNIVNSLASLDIKNPERMLNIRGFRAQTALDCGLKHSTVRASIVGPTPETRNLVSAKLASVVGHGLCGWFAVKCIDGNGRELSDRLKGEGLLSERDLFVPRNIKASVRDGKTVYYNERTVSHLFFFRATMSRALNVQRSLRPKGMVYGSYSAGGEKTLTVIPEAQVENMRRFLGDYDPRHIVFDPTQQYTGRRVRVRDGMFKGCEGVITDVKTKSDPSTGERLLRCFVVQIPGLMAFATQQIEDALLEPIV